MNNLLGPWTRPSKKPPRPLYLRQTIDNKSIIARVYKMERKVWYWIVYTPDFFREGQRGSCPSGPKAREAADAQLKSLGYILMKRANQASML